MDLGTWLRSQRESKGQGVCAAARAAGVSRVTWSRWESGRRGLGASGAVAIAAWAGVDAGVVLGLTRGAGAPTPTG